MKKLLSVILVLVLTSCSKKHEVGQYFYVGNGNVYHIDRECNSDIRNNVNGKIIVNAHDTYKIAFQYANSNQWQIPYGLSSQPIYFCSKCIDDKQMRQIEDSNSRRR